MGRQDEFRREDGRINPGGYGVKTERQCLEWIEQQVAERIEYDYCTVVFPDRFTDVALTRARWLLNNSWLGVRLASVSHRCSPVYDWGTSATFERTE